MGFRDDRLREMFRVKKWEPADVYRETGGRIKYPQIRRYLKEKGTPEAGVPLCDALAMLVIALEVDANYLLNTDDGRYEGVQAERAAAHMSLDRYLVRQSRGGEPVALEDERKLRRLADDLPEPPVWAADWKKQHDSVVALAVIDAASQTQTPSPVGRRRVRRRSLPS